VADETEGSVKILLLFLGLGVVNFLLRLSFIGLLGKREIPHGFRLALHFVPLTVLIAIVIPEIVLNDGVFMPTWLEPKLFAALIAVLVAAKTKKVLPTLMAGMVVLWLLRWWWS
jgi:branched-subunit amino acid transport protein